MIETAINQMANNALVQLIGNEGGARFVGFTIHATYTDMVVMTNDHWREEAYGLPMNSYLLATSLDSSEFARAPELDKRAVLLRITGRTEISTDRDTLRAVMEHFQNNPDTRRTTLEDMEPLSRSILQWSGIKCKVLGTFYLGDGGQLHFGADVEDFFASRHMRVLKPGASALETIVNFVDPVRKKKAEEDAIRMGMKRAPEPFQIGTVRFTSSNHLAVQDGHTKVPVSIFPGDFLGRRTAVFGMTRTGKSNTTKTMVSAVSLSAHETDLAVGQLIFDINGEYANANKQDDGSSIAELFVDNTVRYRAIETPGFRDVRVNFYESTDLGLRFIGSNMQEMGGNLSDDLQTFVSLDLARPDINDNSGMVRWRRRLSMYQAILSRSRYPAPDGMMVTIDAGKEALQALYDHIEPIANNYPAAKKSDQPTSVTSYFDLSPIKGGQYQTSLKGAEEFWTAVRDVEFDLDGHKNENRGIRGGKGKKWLNSEEIALLSVMVGRSSKTGGPIRSTNTIRTAGIQFHSASGSSDVAADIYALLADGRIVILDLSVGPPSVRERMAERIAHRIFDESSNRFVLGKVPPRVVLYVEEAHNLIGKTAGLDETWPRIAKEGAKYGISLVYATQEPSSIHPNILSNTENLFVTHLNNDGEIRALSSYYDFADFSEGLKRCQDVGFARVKTLSSNFISPTQILLFNPIELKHKYETAKASGCNWFTPLPVKNKGE